MCGIFGLICSNSADYNPEILQKTFCRLGKYSESRGKESCGFALKDNIKNEIIVFKGAMPVSDALKNKNIISALNIYFNSNHNTGNPVAVIGHARLVTNGSQLDDCNNQPVIKEGIIGVHNGIIVNAEALWNKYPSLKREYSIDTEAMLAIIRFYIKNNHDMRRVFSKTINAVKGTASVALLFNDYKQIFAGTNNGSLYILSNRKNLLVFASEKNILEKIITEGETGGIFKEFIIEQIKPNTGCFITPDDLSVIKFDMTEGDSPAADIILTESITAEIKSFSVASSKRINKSSLVDIDQIRNSPAAAREKSLLEHNYEQIKRLRRCTKCILPETFPFIEYDDEGVCNYCRNYIRKNQIKPVSLLDKLVLPYRSKNGNPDCIIPLSGGRDSSFVLHYVKKELGLNPIAFTYDWGMVTDLARRNIARVCGKLGVENIIVSADINWKRENIKKNISAWLKKPALGMIPLFMAGDKYFFYYTHQIKKQTGIKLNIWGINPLENTDFKVGFAGIHPERNKKRIYSLSSFNQIKLLFFIANNLLKSPAYINQSVFDTFGSYLVRYFYPKTNYYHFYDYVQWDENLIENTIINEYDWELAVDTKSTWRIGDGTASFYNYVYYTIAGFSENDTFRSNQIREGMISRETALMKTEMENKPRYETIKWYLEIIGLDYENVIKRINSIPKLYSELN